MGMVFLLIPFFSFGQLAKSKPSKHFFDSLKTKHLWLGAQVVPGFGQIYNKQYGKAAVLYVGMGSMLYMGIRSNNTYKRYLSEYNNLDPVFSDMDYYEKRYLREKHTRNFFLAGAGAFYLASVIDALVVYNKDQHSPATATILSTVLPGAGQVYNRKLWKVPVIYGGIYTMVFLVDWNNRRYIRTKKAIREFPNDEYNGLRPVEDLKLYRDIFRKNRDLAFAGLIGVYVLNIIDANVDAHLYDWNVNDDLSFHVEPTILNNNFASTAYPQPAFGLSCTINFK
ncbi:MAG: hypothetical protein EHM93_10375 [Bacteroidales bacterium]|nr:MAG: hypothetical protein EHM93_10375 [Bacteroidales bacterium]